MHKHLPKIAVISAILSFVFFGIGTPIAKTVVETIPPYTFIFLRFSLALLIITPIYYFKGYLKSIERKHLPKILFITFLGPAASNLLTYSGLQQTEASTAAVIFALFPIVTIFLSILIAKEKIRKITLFGSIIALGGTIIIFLDPKDFSSSEILGQVLLFASNITIALYTIYIKKYIEQYNYQTLIVFSFFMASLTSLPFVMFDIVSGINWLQQLNTKITLFILYDALIGGILAYILYESSLKYLTTSFESIFGYIQPIVAVIASMVILQERPDLIFYVGAIFILFGVTIADFPSPKHIHILRKFHLRH